MKVNGYAYKGKKKILPPLLVPEVKNLLPRSKFFTLRVDPCPLWFGDWESKQKVVKVKT